MRLPRNIVLVGFMGTGKSAVGRELARGLSWRFVDSDTEVESAAGRTVGALFDSLGEERFREIESEVIERLSRETLHAVVATGGGAVVREENWKSLRRLGEVVALTAGPEAILERVQRSRRRPLLETSDPQNEVERRLGERAPLYARAPIAIATDGKTPAAIAGEILSRLGRRGP